MTGLAAVDQSALKDFRGQDTQEFQFLQSGFAAKEISDVFKKKYFGNERSQLLEQVTREVVQPSSIGVLKLACTWP